MVFTPLQGGDPLPPPPTGSGSGGLSTGDPPGSPTSSGTNGGVDFSSGGTNPYLPVAPPSTGSTSGSTSTGTSSGSTHTGSTGSTHTSSGSGSSRTSSGSSGSPGTSSGGSGRIKIVTTTYTSHPVKVKWKSTNATGNGPAPLGFIATAGITSHERRIHAPAALHVTPHRRVQ